MKPDRMRVLAKPAATLLSLAVLHWLAPVTPIDPWNLLSPKKMTSMILALAAIQVVGSAMARSLGAKTGAILTGFFGGLVSSTATTASLARRSKLSGPTARSGEILTFLAATGAMLFEGLALLVAGTTDIHFSNLMIFIGPIIATVGMIYVQSRKMPDSSEPPCDQSFEVLPLLKLAVFIVSILTISKIAQRLFGQNGLLILTTLVSLFEIHGSVIANVQLQEAGSIDPKLLSSLFAVSVVASYLSKLFLISTLGSSVLRSNAIKSTALLFGALAMSWALAVLGG